MGAPITASACLNRASALARQIDELLTLAGRLNPTVAYDEIDRCKTCRAITGGFAISLDDIAEHVAADEDKRLRVPAYRRAA